MKNVFRTICAGLTWVTLAVQYGLMVSSPAYGGLGGATLTFLGYFTILSNILVGLAFTAPLLKPHNKVRRFFIRQSVRAAIALYILVVVIVYWTLLAQIHDPAGWAAMITNMNLHFIVPLLYIIDWLVFSPKGDMLYKTLPIWVIYPVLYGMFNIIRGLITGFYPYPFLDIGQLGFIAVLANMIGFTAIYFIGGALFIGLGRILSRTSKARAL